jgi:hypothetical protein
MSRQPVIVRVQKRDPFTLGLLDTAISSRRNTGISLMHVPYSFPVGFNDSPRVIRGTVVYNDDLSRRMLLIENALNRSADRLASIERWNYGADSDIDGHDRTPHMELT